MSLVAVSRLDLRNRKSLANRTFERAQQLLCLHTLPGATAVVLLKFFGVWLVVSGVLWIVFAIEMRKVIDYEWLLAIAGFCSLGAGVLTLLSPLQSAMDVDHWRLCLRGRDRHADARRIPTVIGSRPQ
jgi:hypothetical protein